VVNQPSIHKHHPVILIYHTYMYKISRTLGGDMYYASTAVVVCEVIKFVVSLFLLMKEEESGVRKYRQLVELCIDVMCLL
jgi:hypothetical protein